MDLMKKIMSPNNISEPKFIDWYHPILFIYNWFGAFLVPLDTFIYKKGCSLIATTLHFWRRERFELSERVNVHTISSNKIEKY